jgi:glycosyltransferase involved in cell wall biosynthesis
MKVLLVSDFYPPAPGGLEAHVARLGRHLARRGHQVQVATVGPHGEPDVHGLDLSMARLPGAYRFGKQFHPPWADRAFRRGLERVARDMQPDVMHAHGWSLFSAVHVGRALDVPVVATLHDYGLLCPTKSLSCGGRPCRSAAGLCCVRCRDCDQGLVKRSGLAAALRLHRHDVISGVQRFLAVSSFVADRHLRAGFGTDGRMAVVPNFVDLADENPSSPPVDGPLLFVGPAAHYKGGAVAEAAYHLLPEAVRRGLVRVGTEGGNGEGVRHVGRQAGDALWAQFRSARAVLVPPLWPDPCPTVALEAMALGRPVIASRVGGLTDIVDDGVTGLLVAPADVRAFAAAAGALLDDDGTAERMGAAARVRVTERFSASAVVPRIEAAYRSAAA